MKSESPLVMESTKSGVSIPKWNGKQETFARYAAKVHALAVYYECGDAFEETAATKLVTKAQYDAIADKTTGTGKQQADLYNANKRMCALIVLGQDSDHGLATIQKTTTKDHPHGNASKFLQLCAHKNKPDDATAEIEMDANLERIQFSNANDYYNDVVSVQAKYNVEKTEIELIKLMAKKVTNETYAKMIVDHLDGHSSTPCDLEVICSKINKIQRLTKAKGGTSNNKRKDEKEVQLAYADGKGTFKGVCGNCKKVCGYKRATCPHKAASGKGDDKGTGDRKCDHCGGKGHLSPSCWKKHPEKAPQWYKDKAGKETKETSNTSVEIMLAAVDEEDFSWARM